MVSKGGVMWRADSPDNGMSEKKCSLLYGVELWIRWLGLIDLQVF